MKTNLEGVKKAKKIDFESEEKNPELATETTIIVPPIHPDKPKISPA